MGVAPQELEQIKLNLDFAELALESGHAATAELQARDARRAGRGRFAQGARLPGSLPDRPRARGPGHGRRRRSSSWRPCCRPRVGNVLQIKVGIALSRCYRESGDFSKAVEVGEMILEHLADTPLDASDEAVQMAVTLAAAYFERGDTSQAVRVCRKAITKAETLDSPVARASAYWNASAFEAARRVRSATRSRWPSARWRCSPRARRSQPRPAAHPPRHHAAAAWTRRRSTRRSTTSSRQPRRCQWCSAGPVDDRAQRAGSGSGPLPRGRRRHR